MFKKFEVHPQMMTSCYEAVMRDTAAIVKAFQMVDLNVL